MIPHNRNNDNDDILIKGWWLPSTRFFLQEFFNKKVYIKLAKN